MTLQSGCASLRSARPYWLLTDHSLSEHLGRNGESGVAIQTSRPPAASYLMMDHQSDEYELALRARDGDGEALAELVERTRLRLFALAYSELVIVHVGRNHGKWCGNKGL